MYIWYVWRYLFVFFMYRISKYKNWPHCNLSHEACDGECSELFFFVLFDLHVFSIDWLHVWCFVLIWIVCFCLICSDVVSVSIFYRFWFQSWNTWLLLPLHNDLVHGKCMAVTATSVGGACVAVRMSMSTFLTVGRKAIAFAGEWFDCRFCCCVVVFLVVGDVSWHVWCFVLLWMVCFGWFVLIL